MELIERAGVLAELTGRAARASAGDGQLVLVTGEAGVGKSALVQALRAEIPRARWWQGTCDGLSVPEPLGPLFDLAGQLGGPLFDACRAGAGRAELFRALLAAVAGRRVLDVVVVEDVHWADEATLDLLRFLARRRGDAALLLVVTCRDDGFTGPLRAALGDLGGRRVEVAPLSADGVAELARGSGLPVGELHRLTGGNPFFVAEVVRLGSLDVPPSARDAVLARADGLTGAARAALETLALTGDRAAARIPGGAGDRPALRMPAGAGEELLACGLLVDDGTGLRFRHEIARLAVERTIPAPRRAELHRRILATLRDTGCAEDARLAFHAEAAGDRDAVLRHAPAAADRAMLLGSHREAVAQLRRSIRFAGDRDPGLYDRLADALALVDDYEEAAAAGQRALALWRAADDRLRAGDTLRRLSRIHWNRCDGRAALAAAQAAVTTLEPLGSTIELARALVTAATQQMLGYRHGVAARLAARGLAVAERHDARDVVCDALITRAVSAGIEGRDWAGDLRAALTIALAGGYHEQAARALTNLCSLAVTEQRFAEAEKYLIDGLQHCEEHDLCAYATSLRDEQGALREHTGAWDDAVRISLVALDDTTGSPGSRIRALRRLGTIRARRGEPGVWEHLEEVAAIADASGEPRNIVHARLARAEAFWLAGRSGDAAREAELADDVAESCYAWMRGDVAAWLRRTGSARVPRIAGLPEPYRLILEGNFLAAAVAWQELNRPYDAALALVDAGDEAGLRSALDLAVPLGATALCRIARRRLRRLGLRTVPAGPRGATRAHPHGLTRREEQVLGLVAAGHTNVEIGTRLFISERTVEHHVSALLAKLGVPNRTAAARLGER